ncbi:MAG: hypothetical protein EA406_12475 [Rhodospirillales bacterium]|nr:MAG: hypothetical protein EA406_12475 [Rhodospirillales bacterium]
MEKSDRSEGYLLEFWTIGNSVRVAALDPVTNIEVTIVGPASCCPAGLERVAIAKLRRALSQAARKVGSPGSPPPTSGC